MEPTIVSKPAFTVVGMKYQGQISGNEIGQLWEAFWPRHSEIKNLTDEMTSYGITTRHDPITHEMEHITALEVKSVGEVPAGMVSLEIPAQQYAVFKCTLPTVAECYQKFYQEWLPKSGHRRAPGPEFELYSKDFDPQNPASEYEVYVPIQ